MKTKLLIVYSQYESLLDTCKYITISWHCQNFCPEIWPLSNYSESTRNGFDIKSYIWYNSDSCSFAQSWNNSSMRCACWYLAVDMHVLPLSTSQTPPHQWHFDFSQFCGSLTFFLQDFQTGPHPGTTNFSVKFVPTKGNHSLLSAILCNFHSTLLLFIWTTCKVLFWAFYIWWK